MKIDWKLKTFLIITIVLLGIIVPRQSFSANTLSYHGRLVDSAGTLRSGTFCMKFTIYNSLTAGTNLWTEEWCSSTETIIIPTSRPGVFSVNLGTYVSLPTLNPVNSYYLEIKVAEVGNAYTTLSPRQKLGGSLFSQNSAKLGGQNPEYYLDAGNLTGTLKLSAMSYTGELGDLYVSNSLTIDESGSVDWGALLNYPTACVSGSAVTGIGDTLICAEFWDEIGDIPVAIPSDGDSTHLSTADQIYDFVVGQGYITDIGSVEKDDLANVGILSFYWDDSEISDSLTIDATGSVADGALSSNVSLLGQSISKDELVNSGILSFTWSTSELDSLVMITGANVSLLTNDAGYIIDGNTNWDNSYGFITALSTDTLTNKSGNISMWTNNSGYIIDGNTNWDNSYGFITASSTDTLTNKSGNISMWTNDSGYLTSYTETDPLVGANTLNYLSKWNGTALVTSTVYDNGKVGIGTNSPSVLLELDQGAGDDEILMFMNSDVIHSFTALPGKVVSENTFGSFMKSEATSGGLRIDGYKDGDGSTGLALKLAGNFDGIPDTTKSSAAIGVVSIVGDVSGTIIGSESNLLTVGTSAATRFIFDYSGTGHAEMAWTTFSDARLKTDIKDIPYGLSEVLLLNPKLFNKHSGYINDSGNVVLEEFGEQLIGFLAQDVEKIVPELVHLPSDDKSFYSVNYDLFSALLVKAIQEQQIEIDSLGDINALTVSLQDLISRMDAVESKVSGLNTDVNGNVEVGIDSATGKIIMKSPDGTCSACGPDNEDFWTCVNTNCPQ